MKSASGNILKPNSCVLFLVTGGGGGGGAVGGADGGVSVTSVGQIQFIFDGSIFLPLQLVPHRILPIGCLIIPIRFYF